MKPYPHHQIWINGRYIRLKEIAEGRAHSNSYFETNTFRFISEWMNGAETFQLQTSGSTGDPKKIVVTREQMIGSASLTERALSLKADDTALLALDPVFIAGKMMIVRSFVTGLRMYAVEPSSNPLEKLPAEISITFAAMVPLQVKTILESKHPQMIERVKTCIIGGAPLDKTSEAKLKSFSTSFYQTYGMTETISHIALKNLKSGEDVYTALPGVTVSTDKRSCLVISTPFLTEQVVTNDVVEIFNNNTFHWIGRWDNIINSGGVKVSAEKLEEAIGKIFTRLEIRQPFFIYGAPDERLGERVVLVVQSPAPVASSFADAIHSLVHTFSQYSLPKELYEASEFVFTSTMKVNRRETFKSAKLISRI